MKTQQHSCILSLYQQGPFLFQFILPKKKLMMIKCSKKRSKFDTSIQEVRVKKEE